MAQKGARLRFHMWPKSMETVTIHKAKTQLSRLIEKACRGECVVIALGTKPVVRLVAIEDKRGNRKRGATEAEGPRSVFYSTTPKV